MKLNYNFFIALLIVFLTLNSCKDKGGKFIRQGEVHFNIEYLKSSGSMPIDLKPHTLIVSFKDNKILFEILAPFGNQGITNVINPESKVYDTYINMLGVRYYYASEAGEMYPGFRDMEGAEIRKTDRTTSICGYNCNHAEVTFPADRSKVYDFWYTNEIRVKNSNSSTPFREIDGVLMSFFYIMGGSELKFVAETVYNKDISDKTFERRPKFKPVEKKDMEKIILDMVNL